MNTAPANTTHRPHGFTLVELIITLAVSATLTAMALPSMANLVTRSAAETTRDALFTAAHTARTAAVTHTSDALLCPSSDGRHCCGESSWQHGWIVALDRNRDGQPDGAVLARALPATEVRIIGSTGRDHVRFHADGDAAGTNLTLLLCPRAGSDEDAYVVVVSNSGRVREAKAGASRRKQCRTSP